uniref:ATP synthase subunit s, mitochondrial n=2 Tax=Romanomermis culicivorax TaxID=13658 RepID=A0A915HUR0_ROMCU
MGPDRACAEWVIRCGGSIRWSRSDELSKEFKSICNKIPGKDYLTAIEATDACVNANGMKHLQNVGKLEYLKFDRCFELNNKALQYLSIAKDSLKQVEIYSCLFSDAGLLHLKDLRKLRILKMGDLPNAVNIDETIEELKSCLPNCDVTYKKYENTLTRPTWMEQIFGRKT